MLLTSCYLYTIDTYGYPPSLDDGLRALDDQRELGFVHVELEGVGPEHVRAMHRERGRFARHLEARGMRCVNYCPIVRDLVSLDPARRRAAYPDFELGVETAAHLGARTVHVATYLPAVEFVGAQPYVGALRFGESYRVRMADDYSWQAQWDALVDGVRACAEIAARRDLTLIIEPRVAELVSSTDAMLRLMDHVGRPNLKAVLDCAHLNAQKEILPLSARKLDGRIAGVHLADNDGSDNRHLMPGDGNVDFDGVFAELVRQRYDGFVGIDLGSLPDLGRRFAEAGRWTRDLARRMGFRLEG